MADHYHVLPNRTCPWCGWPFIEHKDESIEHIVPKSIIKVAERNPHADTGFCNKMKSHRKCNSSRKSNLVIPSLYKSDMVWDFRFFTEAEMWMFILSVYYNNPYNCTGESLWDINFLHVLLKFAPYKPDRLFDYCFYLASQEKEERYWASESFVEVLSKARRFVEEQGARSLYYRHYPDTLNLERE